MHAMRQPALPVGLLAGRWLGLSECNAVVEGWRFCRLSVGQQRRMTEKQGCKAKTDPSPAVALAPGGSTYPDAKGADPIHLLKVYLHSSTMQLSDNQVRNSFSGGTRVGPGSFRNQASSENF